jgi:hypothetical protein
MRALLGHLPKEFRARETWRHVTKTLDEAVGGGIQPVEVAVALKLAVNGGHYLPAAVTSR